VIRSFFHLNEKKYLEASEAQSAYRYYLNHRENLLSGEKEFYPIDRFLSELEAYSLLSPSESCLVWHLCYELGLYLMGLREKITEKTPLAVSIDYQKTKEVTKKRGDHLELNMIMKPDFSEYKKSFQEVFEHLERGECYQLNLTFPYEFIFKNNLSEIDRTFIDRADLSPFAHTTFLGDEYLLSNSPECLFQVSKKSLFSFPIKGTKLKGETAWRDLLESKKDKGELYMISDLILNDLNSLSLEAEVVKKRARLSVPGLIHQCSILKLELKQDYTLAKVVRALFPGGSITGAPKKNVMKLISQIEKRERGYYCGSTILKYQTKCLASINIRTAHIPLETQILNYQAGGGITLLSEAHKEYLEMEAKMKSFLTFVSRSNKVL